MSLLGPRRLLPLAACVVVLLSGCGAAGEANPEEIGPRGVDELVIPTPDPDPDDFVAEVDNPWLPFVPGTVWTYDVSGSVVHRLEVRVEDEPKVVAGIPCVVVRHKGTDRDGDVVLQGAAFYAQDVRGNVWLFGEESQGMVRASRDLSRSWSADESGADAGLAMAAAPRVGDGYARAVSPSVFDRSTVLDLGEERTVPAGTFSGLLLVEDTLAYPDGDEPVYRRAYAEGIGLVQQTTVGGIGRMDLAAVSVPTG